jgi:alkanesulfonate monooxygenase SsuD/methylene tetrahydromethanopterin reductase-like flavin-dependent oxidoreductase (luciferase family)
VRLGLNLGYHGVPIARDTTLVNEAERLGYDSVWTAESYGADAVTPLAFLAARTESRRSCRCRPGRPP